MSYHTPGPIVTPAPVAPLVIVGPLVTTNTPAQVNQSNSVNTLAPVFQISVKRPFFKKPILVSPIDNSTVAVGNFVAQTLVGIDPLQLISSANQEFKVFSPRLLNFVEPFTIAGIVKSLFYTEVNSGLAVGDRVFIIGGNYDSNELIKEDKYKKGRDGYKILYIDRCAVGLDIDYTGVLPFGDTMEGDLVGLYYIRNKQDFDHANRQITTKNGIFDYKFNPYNSNIIYSDNDYLPTTGWGENGGLTGSPGFYVKNGTYSWTNITLQFTSGSFSIAQSLTYSNTALKVYNYGFSYSIGPSVVEFREDQVYVWGQSPEPDGIAGTYSTWVINTHYNRSILSKNNFRDGNFKGVWNTGLYGSYNKKISWEGGTSVWNGGTVLNTKWLKGIIDSKFTQIQSFVAEFDTFGLPIQKVVGQNNNGKSYNFIIGSELVSSTIINGSIIDSLIGQTPTYSLVEAYLVGLTPSYDNQIQKANFEGSRILGGEINNAELKNTRSINGHFKNIKSINSNYKLSIITDSTYLSDDIIKILGYDEFNYNQIPSISGASHKVYKFYISQSSYQRLKLRDRFYLKGIKFHNNINYPLNLFDKRFRFSSYTEYYDTLSPTQSFYKRGFEVGAFLSQPSDNNFQYNNLLGGGTVLVGTSSNQKYSLDIVFSTSDKMNLPVSGLNFNTDVSPSPTSSATMPNSLGSILDITGAWILDSDFESGLFKNSNWNSGYHMNYNNDVNITTDSSVGKYYNITVATPSQSLIVTTQYDPLFIESGDSCLSVDNVVYLNAVDYDTQGRIDSFTISNIGTGYTTTNGATATGGGGSGLVIDLVSLSGGVDQITLISGGRDYSPGNTLTISGGNSDAQIIVLSTTGSVTRLPDAYKITSNILGVLVLKEILTGTISVIQSLLDGGLSYTSGALNRWGYLYKAKFEKSKIKEGLFRRAYLKGNLIDSEDYNQTDKDFSNLEGIRRLLISDSIFSNNDNILSKATYMNSSFTGTTDLQVAGIVYNSIWNGLTFSSGVFKEGRWVGGIFSGGLFYSSKTFNAVASSTHPYIDTNRLKNYWTEGLTTASLSNDRYSWQTGQFTGGEFYKSDGEGGIFSGGQFYFSKFYGGTISNGIIGDDAIQASDTHIYNGVITYTYVENATLFAQDTSFAELTTQNIQWKNGIFMAGVFGSDISQTLAQNQAIWSDGVFNNGEFISNARWKAGIFNGGKLTSGFGWTMSNSLTKEDFTWESGTFNGGEFGNANTATNSTWYGGDFNGGEFKARLWNDGVFTGGEFRGSGLTATGGLSSSNASDFTDSFTTDFYGRWRGGFVSDLKDKFTTQEKSFTKLKSAKKFLSIKPNHTMQNILWESGTFSHPRIDLVNSVWLDGAFERGKMTNSSFNPYVKRGSILNPPSFNLNDTSCYWENGRFDGGDFYISEFKDGKFILGTGYGLVFKEGVCNYMNAFNIFWEGGVWRNGNWHGSYFSYDSGVTDDFTLQILYRGMSWSGSQDLHLWNIFQDTTDNDATIQSSTNSNISGLITEIIQVPVFPAIPAIPSDRDLKENLVLVGRSPTGINIYEFNYIGESVKFSGVIAQELVGTEFQSALVKDASGKYLVDYQMIDVEFKKINQK